MDFHPSIHAIYRSELSHTLSVELPMQIIDISLVDDSPGPSPRPVTQSKALWGILLLSILVHAAIIYSLSWTTPVPPEITEPTIQAVLIRLPPTPPETAPVEPEPVLPDVEPKNEAPVTTTDVAPEPIAPAEPTPASDVSEPPLEPDTQPDAQPPAEQPANGEILTQSADSPAPASRSIRQSIGQSLQQQQMQMQQDMAEAAARAYRQQKNSPDLRIGEFDPNPEPTPGEHQINCDKGVNSSLAVVAGLFGGNVKCTQRNDFQQFIDKRLNKTHLDKDN